MSRFFLWCGLLIAAGCSCGGDDGAQDDGGVADGAGGDGQASRDWTATVPLPMAIANNAVASLQFEGGCMLFSGLGIGASLDQPGILSNAYRFREGDQSWLALPDVPGEPRVAASAVGLGGNWYVFGGYSVAAGGAETSHARVDIFDQTLGMWRTRAPIPTPIDDMVTLVYQDRYVYLVSGWSNTANVDLVQIYDTVMDSWELGTPFPGTAAFGHVGAIDGGTMVIVDGAASTIGFPLVTQAWRGDIDAGDHTVITWTDLGAYPGPSRYRAAGSSDGAGVLWFHGGTSEPYNFDGLRYDNNQPAAPIASTLTFDIGTGQFALLDRDKPTATMDHRALARCEDRVYSIGGMVAGPAGTADVWRIRR